jgi:hypothetical protein
VSGTLKRSRGAIPIAVILIAGIALAACGDDASSDGGASASDGDSSAALTPCDINGRQQELGASYVTTLEVEGVECAQGEQVLKAYHQCRRANGGLGGTCDSPVMGFACTEGEREEVPDIQYNATMECSKGSQRLSSTYTQNL